MVKQSGQNTNNTHRYITMETWGKVMNMLYFVALKPGVGVQDCGRPFDLVDWCMMGQSGDRWGCGNQDEEGGWREDTIVTAIESSACKLLVPAAIIWLYRSSYDLPDTLDLWIYKHTLWGTQTSLNQPVHTLSLIYVVFYVWFLMCPFIIGLPHTFCNCNRWPLSTIGGCNCFQKLIKYNTNSNKSTVAFNHATALLIKMGYTGWPLQKVHQWVHWMTFTMFTGIHSQRDFELFNKLSVIHGKWNSHWTTRYS